jgi:acyl-CoA thioesterase
MMASFSKIEQNQPTAQWPIPRNVKPPEESELQQDIIREWMTKEKNPSRIEYYQELIQVSSRHIISVCFFLVS